MVTTFMNSEIRKTPDLHRLILKRSDKYFALSNLGIYYKWKNMKQSYKNNQFKISGPVWTDNLNHLMDHMQCQIFKIILSISLKNIKQCLIILQ